MVRQKPLELELSGPMAHSGEQCLFLRAAFRSEGKRQHWPRRSFCDYLPYFEHLWRPMPPFGSHSAHGSIARASAIIPRAIPRFDGKDCRSEEHTSELQSLMRISYAVFCLKKKNTHKRKK